MLTATYHHPHSSVGVGRSGGGRGSAATPTRDSSVKVHRRLPPSSRPGSHRPMRQAMPNQPKPTHKHHGKPSKPTHKHHGKPKPTHTLHPNASKHHGKPKQTHIIAYNDRVRWLRPRDSAVLAFKFSFAVLPWGLCRQCMEKQPSAFFAQARSPGFANDDDMSGQAAEAQPMISYVARMKGETVIKTR